MNVTEKQRMYLYIISIMTDECYDDIGTEEEAFQIIKTYKSELENNVRAKYFINPDDNRILTMEIYIYDEYAFSMEVKCKNPTNKTDTLDTIDVVSCWIYK